jgi:hypothetical protein
VYLVVFLSPIEAMFAFILMTGLRVLHLHNVRKVTVLNRHSKEVLWLLVSFTLPRSWRGCAKSGGCQI